MTKDSSQRPKRATRPEPGAEPPATPPALSITEVPAARRYEARLGDELAGWVDYGRVGTRLVAVHTEVLPPFGGRGIGSALVRHVLGDARANGLKVTPRCPLFAAHFQRHPEDADLLSAGPQRD
ncbi:MAG: GNAT family N-acetyltransferase [Chloroflexota bacterium]